ncbi:unnamed protein product, partial [Meganyctiphanes norvegica]
MSLCRNLNFSNRQWLIFLVLAVGNFCYTSCLALYGPLYPPLAEEKGASPSCYGLIFGIYNFAVIFVSLPLGKYLPYIGPKRMFVSCVIILALTNSAFGLLKLVDNLYVFVGLSVIIRVIGAIGCAGWSASRNCIVAKEFVGSTGATFAALGSFLGLGFVVGPMVGGALDEYGGFIASFALLGGTQLLASGLGLWLLPSYQSSSKIVKQRRNHTFLQILRVPILANFFMSLFATSLSISFLDATLQRHLRLLGLDPVETGAMFMLRGLSFAVASPLLGALSDKILGPRLVVFLSAVLSTAAFLILGPVPFLPLEISVGTIISSLALFGIGGAGEMMGAYAGVFRGAVVAGFPDDLSTYGLVSGLWAMFFYSGAFIGPSAGGFMIDNLGFDWSSFALMCTHLVVGISTFFFVCSDNKRSTTIIYLSRPPGEDLLSSGQIFGSIETIPEMAEESKRLLANSKTYGSIGSRVDEVMV